MQLEWKRYWALTQNVTDSKSEEEKKVRLFFDLMNHKKTNKYLSAVNQYWRGYLENANLIHSL